MNINKISNNSPLARGVAGGTRRGVAKKIIIAITLALCAFGVRAENETQIATSMGYVAEELETRQDKFQKLGADTAMTYSGTTDGAVSPRTITATLGAETNTSDTQIPTVGGVNTKLANQQDELNLPADTVLVNTGVVGEPAAKGIYDDSGDYNSQTDSLIDAATFNAALQNAINSELSCAVRKIPGDDTSPCYLFDVGAPTTNLIIPDTYTRLEYLESTGEQYINTGILPTNNIGVAGEFAFMELSSYSYIFGSWFPHYYLGIPSTGDRVVVSYGATSGNVVLSIPISGIAIGQKHKFKTNYRNSGIVEFDNEPQIRIEPKNFSDVSHTRIYLFGVDNGGGHTGKSRIYYIQFTDGATLVRNFIPAKRNSDGELGMYDTVTNTFNAGSGTFIAGPELSSNIYLPME